MDTFPNVPADSATTCDEECRLLAAPFGDGYEQLAADGKNHVREAWMVEWTNLNKTEYDAIVGFLKSQGGWNRFFWTPPDKASPLVWTCKKWQKRRLGPVNYKIVAQFVQSFTP